MYLVCFIIQKIIAFIFYTLPKHKREKKQVKRVKQVHIFNKLILMSINWIVNFEYSINFHIDYINSLQVPGMPLILSPIENWISDYTTQISELNKII